jgi:hypothetical protein
MAVDDAARAGHADPMRIGPWDGDLDVAADVLTRGFSDYAVPISETPSDISRPLDDEYFAPETSRIAWIGDEAVGGVFAVRRDDGRGRVAANEWGPGSAPGEIPASYAAEDAPLHRDFYALSKMRGVSVVGDRRTAWAAWRGRVLLAARGWDDESLPALLVANPSPIVRMIDLPEGDPLVPALTRLGWTEYARQFEMVR